MSKAPLSQEEIDALLQAASADTDETGPGENESQRLSGRVVAAPVEFAPMERGQKPVKPEARVDGLSLILDVPMDITVELGRSRRLVRDILSMSPGSVVELDRQAGEPVDILVNGKLLARGEVVVIDENFGVRISEVVSKAERLSGLK